MNSHTTATNRLGAIPVRRDTNPARHRSPWLLTYFEAGSRRRRWFETEEAAVKFWNNHKRLERKLGGLAGTADPRDLVVLDRLRRKLPPGADLDSVVDFYLTAKPAVDAPPLGEAVDKFLAAKRSLARSAAHTHTLEVQLGVFRRTHGDAASLLSFNQAKLLEWLISLGVSARTTWNYANTLTNFFGYWHRRGALPSNPAAEFPEAEMPQVKPTRKVILTLTQARAFAAAVVRECPTYREYFALQLFAGMRDTQAARMDRSFFDHQRRRIIVPAEICKTADEWVLQGLPDILWKWLEAGSGPIASPSNRQWGYLRDKLAALENPAERIHPWPFNALRRTFCTYHISLHGNALKTAALLQHQSPARLYQSYLAALRPKAEARDYFAISP